MNPCGQVVRLSKAARDSIDAIADRLQGVEWNEMHMDPTPALIIEVAVQAMFQAADTAPEETMRSLIAAAVPKRGNR